MRGHAIRRATPMVVGVVLLVGVGFSPELAVASGDGGCGRAVTDASGTRIRIRDFCFGPTILRARPGDTVTWMNDDGVPHTVLGANAAWGGFDSIGEAGEVTYRFVRSGVYPYVCTYHPGMSGAVVVGNATGPGSAHTVTTAGGPVILEPSPVAGSVVTLDKRAVPPERPSTSWPAAVGWGLGAAIVGVVARVLARRRRVTLA